MLSKEETTLLIRRAKDGDEKAKEELVKENSPLIKSLVKRFLNKGIEYDDLFQLGSLGFIKAIYNYDEKFDTKFSTYVVPMVVGEIKRFMRDDGAIKVSRAIKTQNMKISKYVEEFIKKIIDGQHMKKLVKNLIWTQRKLFLQWIQQKCQFQFILQVKMMKLKALFC